MSARVARWAAVWPKRHSVAAFAIFDDGNDEKREFAISNDGVDGLAEWVAPDKRTIVGLLTVSGIGNPWAEHPAGVDFRFGPEGPTLADWRRFRDEQDFPAVRWFELSQAIHLALRNRASVLALSEAVVEALPPPKAGRRDTAWGSPACCVVAGCGR